MSGASDGLTLAGGAGNDTIELEDNIDGISAMVIGGSGDDSIYFTDLGEDDDYSAISVVGGAGADSITFSAGQTSVRVKPWELLSTAPSPTQTWLLLTSSLSTAMVFQVTPLSSTSITAWISPPLRSEKEVLRCC